MFNWDESAPGCQSRPLLARISPLGWGPHPACGRASWPRRGCCALGVGFRPLPDSTPHRELQCAASRRTARLHRHPRAEGRCLEFLHERCRYPDMEDHLERPVCSFCGARAQSPVPQGWFSAELEHVVDEDEEVTAVEVWEAVACAESYWPGGRGRLPTRGSHRSGRAQLRHPAPRIMVSLLDGTRCARRAQVAGNRC